MAESIPSSNTSAGNLKKTSISGTKSKPRYMADTLSSSAKYRTKVLISARSGFVNIIKRNPGIPTIPPEKRNFKFNHLPSENKQESIQSADSVVLILAADSETSNNLEQVQSVPSVALITNADSDSENKEDCIKSAPSVAFIHDDDSVSTNDGEFNHSLTQPLPSPSHRGGVMAATIASSAKQRAKFQGADNSNGIEKERWNSSPKLNRNDSNIIKLPRNSVSTTWEDDEAEDSEEDEMISEMPNDFYSFGTLEILGKRIDKLEIEKKELKIENIKWETQLWEETQKNRKLLRENTEKNKLIDRLREDIRLLKEERDEACGESRNLRRAESKRRKNTHWVTVQNGSVVSLPSEYPEFASITFECTNITFISTAKSDANCTMILPVYFIPNDTRIGDHS